MSMLDGVLCHRSDLSDKSCMQSASQLGLLASATAAAAAVCKWNWRQAREQMDTDLGFGAMQGACQACHA